MGLMPDCDIDCAQMAAMDQCQHLVRPDRQQRGYINSGQVGGYR
jgi:hypothetical protein